VRQILGSYFVFTPTFFNSVFSCLLIENRRWQLTYLGFSFLLCVLVIIIEVEPEAFSIGSCLFQIVITCTIIFIYWVAFIKISLTMEQERTKFLVF